MDSRLLLGIFSSAMILLGCIIVSSLNNEKTEVNAQVHYELDRMRKTLKIKRQHAIKNTKGR